MDLRIPNLTLHRFNAHVESTTSHIVFRPWFFRKPGIIFLGNTVCIYDKVVTMRAIRALIHGRVQGVFFRAYTRDKAYQLQLVGWVRNNRDGTVECHAQGVDQAVVEFISFLHQGSPSSQVDNVAVTEVPVDVNLRDFRITY